MSQTFQLYLTSDLIKQKECIAALNEKFDTNVEQWYANPEGNFKYFFRLKTRKDGNKWQIAKEIRDTHDGVLEVDPVAFLTGQRGAYESDEDYPDPGSPNWNHGLTKFPDAIQKSINDGKLDTSIGTLIRIAHFDTGITKHPELPDFKYTGYNFVEGNDDVTDLMDNGILRNAGHGTGTASVIVGQQQSVTNDYNNGVFLHANLVPYRIARSVIHFINSKIDEAVIHAVKSGIDVMTMSMGGAPPRRSWKEASKFAYDNGVIFCCAAGNNVGFVIWPAAYDEVLAIAAINVKKDPWEGSCRGSAVDASAPGENVYVARSKKAENNMVYDQGFGCGTSFAVPHVASAAALWLNYYKDEIAEVIEKPSDKVDLFRTALKLSLQPHNPTTDRTKFGAGILDARRLLDFSPAIIKGQHNEELLVSKSFSQPGRGLRGDNGDLNLVQKEMLDLMTNNDHENYPAMIKFIEKEGTQEAKNAFDNLKAMAPVTAEKSRGLQTAELKEVRQIFAKEIIDGNY